MTFIPRTPADARQTQVREGADLTAAHSLSAQQVAERLEVDPSRGLAVEEIDDRRERWGRNELTQRRPRPAVLRFLDQFRSVLILVLVAAAVLAGIVGDLKDTVVIAAVLLLNAGIGFFQERRAEKSLEALREMLVATARVRRSGGVVVVDAADLVPGDVVLLEAGDRVPADGRLTLAAGVEVDESALTGESQPVVKSESAVPVGHSPLAERTSMVHMNTALTRGRAEMVVTASGMNTAVGTIAEMLAEAEEPKTPLQVQLDTLGKRLAVLGLIAVSIYSALALMRGEAPSEIALRAVALAVATVPEGLPAVLALTLALGVQRMSRRNAIVKRLASVETLGSATVICSDKTGTLTLNEMTARVVHSAGRDLTVSDQQEGDDSAGVPGLDARLLDALVLCSDVEVTTDGVFGDPTEGALVVLATKAGRVPAEVRRDQPRLHEIPFDADYKYMATYHDSEAGRLLYAKGAADVLLARCTRMLGCQGLVELDDQERDQLAELVRGYGARGLRVLAVATRHLGAEREEGRDLHDDIHDLLLLGLVGIADPPRPEARDAVRLCQRAGISVKMITGDHVATAETIAREVGITGRAVTGSQLDDMSEEELAAQVDEIGVFARVAPEHKVAIVRALTSRGHVVAMTGDGVNDAAALRNAHIGVAMGLTGTEVTKEASAVILTDDNFATIVSAVEEGRAIYDNVVKFVRFQLSTNVGAIGTFLGASMMGLPAPLTAVQILWVNIIMDGPPAMALGVDPVRRGIMDEAPRRQRDQILSRPRLLKLLRVGAVMAAGTLGVLLFALDRWDDQTATTLAFTTFVLFQLFNALNARVEHQTIFTRQLFANRWLWGSLSTVALLQVGAIHTAWGQAIFDTVALNGSQWALCLGVATSVLVIEEVVKLGRGFARGASKSSVMGGEGERGRSSP